MKQMQVPNRSEQPSRTGRHASADVKQNNGAREASSPVTRKRGSTFVLAAGLVVAIAGLTSANEAQSREAAPDYTRRVARPFPVVLAAVAKAGKANGFHISGKHDVAASLRKAGITHRAYTVVEICDPRIAAIVLAAEPRLGAMMPCRIAVYDDGVETTVTTVLPSRLAGLFHNPRAQVAARKIDHDLREIINEAVK